MVEIPDSIKENLKIEYKPNVPVSQPIDQNVQNKITFKPLPSTSSEVTKPSPKTRSQKGKQNKNITRTQMDKNKLVKNILTIRKDDTKIQGIPESATFIEPSFEHKNDPSISMTK